MSRVMSVSGFNISEIFSHLIDKDDEIIIIHSSLMHLKLPENEIKWPLLSTLKALISQGYTIAIPSFTFSFTKTGYYDPVNSPSEVGILGDWFRELYGIKRTDHPIYSFAIGGRLVDEVMQVATDTCFSLNSIFSYFSKKRSRIVLLGCDYSYTTQLHHYEELAAVPYRLHKVFSGNIVKDKKVEPVTTSMYVRNLDVRADNDFSEVFSQLEKKQLISKIDFGFGAAHAFSVFDLEKIALSLLKQDNLVFLKNKSVVSYNLTCEAAKKAKASLRVAILGNSNLDLLMSSLRAHSLNYIKDRTVEFFSPAFGQSYHEMINPQSGLNQFNPDYYFFIDTLADIFQVEHLEDIKEEQKSSLDRYLSLISQCAEKTHGRIFVNNFISVNLPIKASYDYVDDNGISVLIENSNHRLRLLSLQYKNIVIIDLAELAVQFCGKIYDRRLWYIGRFRYTQEFYKRLATKYMGCLLAAIGGVARVVAVDLDNTLWGGVLGEDGAQGINIGGDFPGNAFKAFQAALLKLFNRGIAIAILSKNDEMLALEVMRDHSEMMIRPNNLAAYYINWNEKYENLLLLSREIGVGLENILFIDDNPVEREKIRVNLPAVKVLELSADPADYVDLLMNSPYVECLSMTSEDEDRAKYYVKRRVLNASKHKFQNVGDFLKAQDMKVYINKLSKYNFSRAVQLLNKTNQFNTTTKRYSEAELENLQVRGSKVFVVGLSDVLNKYENIGLFILNNAEEEIITIDSFLLSCRVLGRGIETAMLTWIASYAEKHNASGIAGNINFSARNTPVRKLYEDNGFSLKISDEASQVWYYDFKKKRMSVPEWLELVDNTGGVNHVEVL